MRKGNAENITDNEQCTANLKEDNSKAAQIVPPEAQLRVIDSGLLHMWEAKQGLQKRWNTLKLNRTLRKKDSHTKQGNREIRTTALPPAVGRNMRRYGQLRAKQNMELLKPEDTKAVHRQNINKILHAYKGTEQGFVKEVELKYICQAPTCVHPDYVGAPR